MRYWLEIDPQVTPTNENATEVLPSHGWLGLQLRLGYNTIYHGDAGVWEDEKGGGFGFSPAWLYSFNADRRGLYVGGRLDVWFNGIDG